MRSLPTSRLLGRTGSLLRRAAWGLVLVGALATPSLALARTTDDAAALVLVPAGRYQPLLQRRGDTPTLAVDAYRLARHPVTNAEFLAFVQAHPKWRRSQVSSLFADRGYLAHWAGDLELGPGAPAEAPVVNVSWFAARAYARSRGERLPTTAEWERAAAVGWTIADARQDAALQAALYRWLAVPTPAVLATVHDAPANLLGVRGLLGLVWEWVEDFNTAMVSGESRADSSPDSNQFCGAGAVGAKDTADYAAYMRLALRSSLRAAATTNSLGFRCAQSVASDSPLAVSP